MKAVRTACIIGDLVAAGQAEIKTGPFGTQLHASEYAETGTPVLNVGNIGLGDVRVVHLDFVDEATVERLSSHVLRTGDIVFGRRASSDRHAFIGPRQEGWLQGTDCIRVRIEAESVVPRYLSYCFLLDGHRQWMVSQSSHGATMTSLNQDIVSRIQLQLPPVDEQRRVTSVLSSYDDLIENNTRRIAILEEMAQSLYREWFVNFRFSGHQDAQMVESEIGPVPEGWRIDRLGELARVNASSLRPQQALAEIAYVDISSVSVGRIEKIERMRFEEAPGRARRKVQHGDIIWSNVRPNRRSHALILEPPPDLIVSTGFAVVSATRVPWSYLYQFATTDEFVGYLTNHATGAAYPAVTARDFENATVVVASEELMQRYHDFAEPLYAEREVLLRRNAVLRRTRDLLLPKLVSGEIDVSDLDIRIPEAVE